MATGFDCTGAASRRDRPPVVFVYTPDVLAVGEGPASWTDFFSQQTRWSRGTYGRCSPRRTRPARGLGGPPRSATR